MCFRENNNDRSKRTYKSKHGNAVSLFHSVNLKASGRDITLKNLALITVASIHRIRKSTKTKTPKQGGR